MAGRQLSGRGFSYRVGGVARSQAVNRPPGSGVGRSRESKPLRVGRSARAFLPPCNCCIARAVNVALEGAANVARS